MNAIDQFREQTRSWLEANCPPSQRKAIPEGEMVWGAREMEFPSADAQVWFERMRDKGWFCPEWPVEYGGAGLSDEYNAVLESELRRLKCRPPQINLGIWLLKAASNAPHADQCPPNARVDAGQLAGARKCACTSLATTFRQRHHLADVAKRAGRGQPERVDRAPAGTARQRFSVAT